MEKELWSGRGAFIMAAVGSAVGLGNLWRFPYVAYQNGGGAFLIPWLVALVTAGIPLMMLEFALGHMFRAGAPKSFHKLSRSGWIGWGCLLNGFVIVSYYAVVIGWVFAYLYYSLGAQWGDNAEDFFFKGFLSLSSGPGQIGGIRWPILLGLALTWISIFLIIFKGVKIVGKVVAITVPLPTILILLFVIRGVTLDGAMEGLKFYLKPDFGKLLDPKVWLAAYAQIFFSLSLAFGIMIAYASYLHERSDITGSAIATSVINCGTSFVAGFAVFSVLGYLALQKGVEVPKVVAGGPSLAFVTYPTAIRLLPFGVSFFGLCFFIMLLTLGIDSAFSLVEAFVAGIRDTWRLSRTVATIIACLLPFAAGIIFATKAGLLWLDIVDHYITNFGLTLFGAVECLFVAFFGRKILREHMNSVSNVKVGRWWDFCIGILTPLILIVSIVMNFIERVKKAYGGYPQWALAVGGWAVVALVIILAFVLGWVSKRRFEAEEG